MEKKYYTPTIEEFHVGFKYEIHAGFERFYKGESDVIETSGLYYSHQFHRGSDLTMIAHGINKGLNSVRVKYLDQEDIESLGFVKWPDRDVYDLGEFQLHLGRHVEPYKVEIYDDNYQYCFVGVIKNKSELKKVLKMIGYECK